MHAHDDPHRTDEGRWDGAKAKTRTEHDPTGLTALQRTVGNAAVTRLVARALAGPVPDASPTQAPAPPGPGTAGLAESHPVTLTRLFDLARHPVQQRFNVGRPDTVGNWRDGLGVHLNHCQ
jgi:hypothetical protein